MGLSKAKLHYIRSLKEKKQRLEHATFVAEGDKMVGELLGEIPCQLLVATKDFISEADITNVEEVIEVSDKELEQASFLKNPQHALAVFYQPRYNFNVDLQSQLVLAIDGVQDPGNMGTIVRLADWYGIEHIICSLDTADIYNPKTVQATMGALARVQVHYIDLKTFMESNIHIPIYGTFLDGTNMYEQQLSAHGIIVMGNEGNGIRADIERLVNKKLYIPTYATAGTTSESLNVAIATAIVCAEFRRRSY